MFGDEEGRSVGLYGVVRSDGRFGLVSLWARGGEVQSGKRDVWICRAREGFIVDGDIAFVCWLCPGSVSQKGAEPAVPEPGSVGALREAAVGWRLTYSVTRYCTRKECSGIRTIIRPAKEPLEMNAFRKGRTFSP